MKLTCDVRMLAKALSAVMRALPPRTALPVLGNVLVKADEQAVTLMTTDLEIAVRTSIPAEVTEVGMTTVPVRLMAGVVSELPEDRLTVALTGTRVRISAGRYSTTLHTIDVDEFPPGPQPAAGEAVKLPRQELLAAIDQVRPAVAAPGHHNAVLTGMLLRLDGSNLTLVGTDGHRLSVRRVDGVKSAPETAIVPMRALAELGRVFREESGDVELRFSSSRNQVFFRCGASEIASRLLDGQYPRYEQVIPQKASTVVRVVCAELLRAVRMVGIVSASMDSRLVSLRFGPAGIELTSHVLEVGDAAAELEAEVNGGTMEISFNSRWLLDVLSAADAERVEMRLTGALEPAVIRGVGADTYTSVIMPVRVTAPPRAAAEGAAA